MNLTAHLAGGRPCWLSWQRWISSATSPHAKSRIRLTKSCQSDCDATWRSPWWGRPNATLAITQRLFETCYFILISFETRTSLSARKTRPTDKNMNVSVMARKLFHLSDGIVSCQSCLNTNQYGQTDKSSCLVAKNMKPDRPNIFCQMRVNIIWQLLLAKLSNYQNNLIFINEKCETC